MKVKLLVLVLVGFVVLSVVVFVQILMFLKQYRDWVVYVLISGSGKVCYVLIKLMIMLLGECNYGDVFFFVMI